MYIGVKFDQNFAILIPIEWLLPRDSNYSETSLILLNAEACKIYEVEEGTLPWTIFRFRIFSNYFSQKFEKIPITVWKSDNLTMHGIFCLDLY